MGRCAGGADELSKLTMIEVAPVAPGIGYVARETA